MKYSKARVAILASGSGTNAERLMIAAAEVEDVDVVVVVCNQKGAAVIDRARRLGVHSWVIRAASLTSGEVELRLKELKVNFIALAGFLLKVPDSFVAAFSGRILNLHPSLLPAFGGKGMYGHHVHRSVASALAAGKVDTTGITLHWVDVEYDTGPAFFQAEVRLEVGDDAEAIAGKIHKL